MVTINKYIFIFCVFCITAKVNAQTRNDWWFFGDSAGVHFISNIPVPVSGAIVSNEASASISDTAGNLLFYVGSPKYNGIRFQVFNYLNQLMLNGDSIFGISYLSQAALILPFTSDTSKYFIFHQGSPTSNPSPLYLYYTVVDMILDSGKGEVISKNNPLYTIQSISEKRVAVKNANGRDWWLINHQINNDTFILYSIINDSITGPFYQNIGSPAYGDLGGQMAISPDGTKLFMPSFTGVADLFDFDRCTGIISNWKYLGDSLQTWDRFYGASFADNNLLYYSTRDSLWQIDAANPNPLSTKILVWVDNNPDACIGQHLMGPDKKIYISIFRGIGCGGPNTIYDSLNTHLTVIDQTNIPGVGCNLLPYNVLVGGKRTFGGLPNNPNYYLSSLPGSPCDSLNAIYEQHSPQYVFKIFPNPNNGTWTLKYFFHNNERASIEIIDITGRILDKVNLVNAKNEVNYSNSKLQEGIYFCRVIANNQTVYEEKLIIIK